MASHDISKLVDGSGDEFNFRDPTKESLANKVTSVRASSSATDTNYPSEKAVRTELDKKVQIYNEGSEVPSSQDLVCLRIKCPYVSGVNKSQVLLYDITSFADGTIVNNDGAYVTFKGFLIGGKPTGSGDAICVKICAKVAYTQISASASFRTLKSDSSICGPEIIKRTEDGVDKYYLSIFYESTLFQGNDVLVGSFRWRAPNGISDYSYKNGVIGEYRPNQTYPANEPFWDRLISFTSNVAANTSASADKLSSSRKLKTNLARTADSTFDGSADQLNIPVTGTLPIANGGTGAMSAIAAEYNILNQVADIDTTVDGDRKIALCNATKSASNGVFRWIKLNNIWTWIQSKISSVLGLSTTGYTGNAATATDLAAGSVLSVGKGGTGGTSVTSGNYVVGAGTSAMVEKTPKEVGSDVLSHLDADNGNVVDDDYIVGSYHVNDTTISSTLFVRRTAVKLWNYIKSKLAGSDVNIGGNAATATKATQDGSGNTIDGTYKKHATNDKFVVPQWIDDNTRTSYQDIRIGNKYKLLSVGISGNGNMLIKEIADGRDNSPSEDKSIIYTSNGGTSYNFNGNASTATALVDDSGYVHTSGNESIGGTKKFTAKEVFSESTEGSWNGFLAKRTNTSTNKTYKVSLEAGDNGDRGIYDYDDGNHGGENKWLIKKDANNNISIGESSNINKVSIGGVTLDFSGTLGSNTNTLYFA